MAMVFHTERTNTGSVNVARQLSSVQGWGMLKNPKSFIKVPATNRTVGTAVMTKAKRSTTASAG